MKSAPFLMILLLILVLGPLSAQQPHYSALQQLARDESKPMLLSHSILSPGVADNYDLKYHRFVLRIDPSIDSIQGTVTSYFVSMQEGLSQIVFQLNQGMSADSAYFHGQKASIDHVSGLLTVHFAQAVDKDNFDSVTVFYHGNPESSGFGSYGHEVHAGAHGMWTLSEPFGASDWWPSKNDLTDKIDSVDMYVVTPNIYHVSSNGLRLYERPIGLNYRLTRWQHKYPIASYLIAVAVTNYAQFDDWYIRTHDSVRVMNFVYPEDSLNLSEGSKSVVPSMALFEDLFCAYPFDREKYGQTQFGWGGGMEHQTNTFLGKGAFNSHIISHELSHHWFGDMITCGSWHDIWLNEGFASYCTGLYYERYSNDLYWPEWKRQVIAGVISSPGGSVYCDDTTQVYRIFDGRLSYGKGSMLLHMLRWVMGGQAFFEGMKAYVNDLKLRYSFAYTSDFKAHMEAVYGKDLTWFFNDWFTGQGYPIYSIHVAQRADQNATVIISQTQSHSSVSFFEMPVPLRFWKGGKDTLIVFNNTTNNETFYCNPGFVADSVQFDPEQWITCKVTPITYGRQDMAAPTYGKVIPLPANEKIQLQFPGISLSEMQLFSLDGRHFEPVVLARGHGELTLDVRNLAPGIYWCKAICDTGPVTFKIIVAR